MNINTKSKVMKTEKAVLQIEHLQKILRDGKKLNKESIEQVGGDLISNTESPLELALQIDYMTKVLANAKAKLMEMHLEDFDNSGKIQDIPYKKMEAGTKYSFASNRKWFALQQKINELKEQMKPIEESMKEALKQYEKGNHVVDKDTGEVKAMATKTSTTIIKFDYK